MTYIPHAWRTNYPVRGYTLDLEDFTEADIRKLHVRMEILEEWQECETANEVHSHAYYANYHRRWHKLKRKSKCRY